MAGSDSQGVAEAAPERWIAAVEPDWRRVADAGSFPEHLARVGLTPQSIVQVSLGDDGTWAATNFPQAELILVDPVPAPDRAATVSVTGKAVSSAPGRVTVWMDPATGRGRSDAPEDGATRRSVAAETFDAVLADLPPLLHPSALRLTSTGNQFEALRSGLKELDAFELVLYETGGEPLRSGGSGAEDAVALLASAGFVPYDIVARRPDERPTHADRIELAFVRANSPLRKSSQW